MSDTEFRAAAVKVLDQYRTNSTDNLTYNIGRMPSAVLRKEVEHAVLCLCPDVMRSILWAGY
jgi:hypothetical protein